MGTARELPGSLAGKQVAVVGAGPNGLTAAQRLAQAGAAVTVFEAAVAPGGAARSADVFGDGSVVDLGAAAHPFGVASPAFARLGVLDRVEFAATDVAMAHPLPGTRPAALLGDWVTTASRLPSRDARRLRLLVGDIATHIDDHLAGLLGPVLRVPPHPLRLAQFGPRALPSARRLYRTLLRDEAARAILAGAAAHAISPLTTPLTGAFALLFTALGVTRGWPVVRGGTGRLTAALAEGLDVRLGHRVTDLRELAGFDAVLLDVAPRQALSLGGRRIGAGVRRRLANWRPGSAAFKVDYQLTEPVPWRDPAVRAATTVHVAGSVAELEAAEAQVAAGRHPARPFVMVCQQQAADPTRGGETGRTVIWAYAHIPQGHPGDGVLGRMEAQIERFAPGFRDVVLHRRVSRPADLAALNENLAGGDIANGAMSGTQILFRPGITLQPYRLGRGLYLCSAATPPGGGVHGMCGWHAAGQVMRDLA